MNIKFFKDQFEFRLWLEENHKIEKELIVGFYKVSSPNYNMSWSESVDQALCFGWIDGIRRSIDDESYCIRFTPRKKSSIWSKVNIEKVEKLKQQGLMQESGLIAYSYKTEEKSKIYSFEKEVMELSADLENLFKNNTNAWDYFINQTPSFKKMVIHWIMSAKNESTRLTRLNKLMIDCENKVNMWEKYKKK